MPEPEDTDDVDVLARRFGYDGRFLRAVRESQGISLESLARTTRISLRYLEALEGNAFDRLPSKVFVRGYVREVARELELEDSDVVEQYVSLYEHHGG
jgi:cytoskeletal protein RodZ